MPVKSHALILALATLLMAAALSVSVAAQEPLDYVSTLVGTQSTHSFSSGNTYPAAARPWGAHFWTPQTGNMEDRWIYTYTDTKIRGIRMTHQPSPWIGDYGCFSIMPVTTGPVYREADRESWFSHKAETARPEYYSVYLAEHDAKVELTPTSHAAMLRLTYPERDMSYLVVDAFDGGSDISVEGNRITGFTVRNFGGVPKDYKLWFVVDSDTAFDSVRTIREGGRTYALVGFRTARHQQVHLRVAASFVSPEQALTNLGELEGNSFDSLVAEGAREWNETLGRIRVDGGSHEQMKTFYSCLYRCLLFPRDLSELTPEGKRVHGSPYDGKVHEGYLFTDTGFWDTFRSLFALVDLVYPEQAAKMQEGLVNCWKESGFLPEWASPGHRGCMVGNNSASVVAEGWLKGLRGYDVEQLWEAVNHGAHALHPQVHSCGRLGWQQYDELGYVPCDVGINESAARTLEYAYDDWCIWRLGKALGKSESEIAPYAKAAMNYRKLYRADLGLMAGRKADGSFPHDFNAFKWGGDFTEGNAFQYSWSVFHDPAGLAELMGGKDAFDAALDNIFNIPPVYDDSYYGFTIHEIREMQVMDMGNYAHGNQPVQHVIYLYDWCARPWKTQSRVREVMDKFYSATPDGYCGDEDNGQTSAWYVFSALGFYPVCPASCEYAIGSPLFESATISLPSGKKISIRAKGNSAENVYIAAMKLDGKTHTRNYLTHEQLVSGANISFTMSAEPNLNRGTAEADAPYSFSKTN